MKKFQLACYGLITAGALGMTALIGYKLNQTRIFLENFNTQLDIAEREIYSVEQQLGIINKEVDLLSKEANLLEQKADRLDKKTRWLEKELSQ